MYLIKINKIIFLLIFPIILLVVIGCYEKNIKEDKNYFINEDLKHIVDKILIEDNLSDTLILALEDRGGETQLNIFAFDYLENCDHVVEIFKYKNSYIILVNNSSTHQFHSFINLNKIEKKFPCKPFIKHNDDIDIIEYKAYSYLLINKNLHYLNKSNIRYHNGDVLLY